MLPLNPVLVKKLARDLDAFIAERKHKADFDLPRHTVNGRKWILVSVNITGQYATFGCFDGQCDVDEVYTDMVLDQALASNLYLQLQALWNAVLMAEGTV